jgi:outer membrane protein OmpA-like peptidoglycan-associated protein
VTGVAPDNGSWARALRALRDELPAQVQLTIDVFLIDETLDVDAVCVRMFAAISDAPIEFPYSASEVSSSSYPALERLIDFSRNCRNGVIRVSGHSDNTGDQELNDWLSRQRAQAVADFLQSGGIPAKRLQVIGKGASEPVADNGTRAGRARNRRIEFEFRPFEQPE